MTLDSNFISRCHCQLKFSFLAIYGWDMQINHFFEVTACKSKYYLPKFYIFILTPYFTPNLNFSDLLMKN